VARLGIWLAQLLLLTGIASAQFNSSIQGVVTDASSAIVPGATVTVTNTATGVARQATTSDDGLYRVTNLGSGSYRVSVEFEGFRTAERPSVVLGITETVRADFALEVGSLVDQVTVNESIAQVETESGRISGRIESIKLTELPMNGKNLFSLLAFQPGVTGRGLSGTFRGAQSAPADSFSGETSPSINAGGQDRSSNTFTLDDNITNSPYTNGTNLTPNADSVEEVRVTANNFSAEDGRGAAARVQIISKSGGNELHGGLSYFFQNNTLSARNVFESGSVPVFRRNQFGYFVGGPIIKNRTFFFTSYEGLRSSGARGGNITVETPEFRAWVQQALPGTIAAQVFRDFPSTVAPTSSFVSLSADSAHPEYVAPPAGMRAYGSASFAPTSIRNGDQFSARIDHELRRGTDKVFVNFYRTHNWSYQDLARPEFNRDRPEKSLFFTMNHTHIFSPTMINEFTAGTMRYEGNQEDPPHLEIPRLTVAPLQPFGDASYPLGWFQYGINFKDVFSVIRSNHAFKVGGEVRRVPLDAINTANYIPNYTFNTVLSFVNDDPLTMTRLVDPVTGDPKTNDLHEVRYEYAAFVEDDWKVRPNLTLNLGMRWEAFMPTTNRDGVYNTFVLGSGTTFAEQLTNGSAEYVKRGVEPDLNNFAPRFGFAWNPGGKGTMAVRGGYGITFDRPGSWGGYVNNPPLRATVTLGEQFGTDFTYSLGDPSKPFHGYPVDPALRTGLDEHNGIRGVRANTISVDPNMATAYLHNWFFGVQREVYKGWILDANYIGTQGHKLYNNTNVNRYAGDLLDGRYTGYSQSFNSVNWVQSNGNSYYHAGTAQLRRPFANGFLFEAAFTMGKAISETGNPQDVSNRRAERGPTDFDVARRASFVGVWEIPFLKNAGGVAGALLGGWQLSGTMVMQSGQALTVTHNASYPRGDFNADGQTGDRPNAPADSLKRDGFETADYLSGIFKAADFPAPAAGTSGNLGRGVFRGPGYIQMDASLTKKFAFTERVGLQVKVDGYNLPNRTNLQDPVTDLNNNNFGKSVEQLNPKAFQAQLRLTF
jgi:hypothetical protein